MSRYSQVFRGALWILPWGLLVRLCLKLSPRCVTSVVDVGCREEEEEDEVEEEIEDETEMQDGKRRGEEKRDRHRVIQSNRQIVKERKENIKAAQREVE